MGEQWRGRINESLDSVTFLIPILTPRFFRSSACRDELERFLQREKDLGRGDLILPIYYLECPLLSDPAKRSNDALAEIIHSRQYWDWRRLRFEPLEFKEVRETIANMAEGVIAALNRPTLAKSGSGISGSGAQVFTRPQESGTHEPFKEATAVTSPAFFFAPGDAIASFSYPGEQKYTFDGDRVIYIRLFPKSSTDQPKIAELR
jgi:hypothetical protein